MGLRTLLKEEIIGSTEYRMTFLGYPNGVKGYMLLDPSIDRIINERNVQFEETPLHAPLEPHANTCVPLLAPDINDDDSTHSDLGSDLSSQYDLEYDEHIDYQHADVEPPQMPKRA